MEFLQGASPLAMLVLLSSFGFVTLGVAVAARQLHHRSLGSILGPYSQGLRQFWQVFRALLILGVLVAALPPYDMGAPLTQNMALSTWLFLLAIFRRGRADPDQRRRGVVSSRVYPAISGGKIPVAGHLDGAAVCSVRGWPLCTCRGWRQCIVDRRMVPVPSVCSPQT